MVRPSLPLQHLEYWLSEIVTSPLPSFPSPSASFPTILPPSYRKILTVTKTFYSHYFLAIRHGYEKPQVYHKRLSVLVPISSASSLYIPMACAYLFTLVSGPAWAWSGLGMRLIHFLLWGLYIQSSSNFWLLSYGVLMLQAILAWYQFCMKITMLLLLAMWVQIDGSSTFIFILAVA